MQILSSYIYRDEKQCVDELLSCLSWDSDRAGRVHDRARDLVMQVRSAGQKSGELESFLQQYGLNTQEGLALMTLAEALLRIPDPLTAHALIHDKVSAVKWLKQQGKTKDFLVKAAGLGLGLSAQVLDSAFGKLSEGVILKAIAQAMRMLGKQFILGQSIEEAVVNAAELEKKGYRLSYDMLGEGARTAQTAEKFFESYRYGITHIAAERKDGQRPGMSVKLSALNPRYEYGQADRCVPELTEKLRDLAILAAEKDVALTVDSEEADRLELSMQIIESVACDPLLKDWNGFGLAVQAYQKRAMPLINHITEFVRDNHLRMQVRLVKGAYWDTEIRRAQLMGLSDYPVFTRKANTDVSYLACAQKMLDCRDRIYPMFATHNAHSVAAILEMAGAGLSDYEFQRLRGMGRTLHDQVLKAGLAHVSVYAPCGTHEELLPYLVRRLLENGASTSFVYQILDENVPLEDMVVDPVASVAKHESGRHAHIPLPKNIYEPARRNSTGMDLTDDSVAGPLIAMMKKQVGGRKFEAAPVINGKTARSKNSRVVLNPADQNHVVGKVWDSNEIQIDQTFEFAKRGFIGWNNVPAEERANVLEKLANLMETKRIELMGLCVFEAGKTAEDALAEIREAVDFCRYYAQRGRGDFHADGLNLVSPTGETNKYNLQGRGVFVCISPWNFPLAIFTGQIVAALMAGNSVIAKPAEQTCLIAMRMEKLIHQAGVPKDVFHLLPGDGEVGAALVRHKDVAGVAFTGSSEVARLINRSLANKEGAIVPLIAETGGQNAMIVDSSALPEQVIDDVLYSAFGSAGQRCSALRVLYVQEDIADLLIDLLAGAMAEMRVGQPIDLSSDVGPVIDGEALEVLNAHKNRLEQNARFIAQVSADQEQTGDGNFFAPCAYAIDDIAQLEREVFGPILHVIRYKARDIDQVIDDINATGYGLTFGVHSRIGEMTDHLAHVVNAGNIYVNRGTIGAVVGVQPFGGCGLSGTGPKAGGPHYLHRFATEKVISTDTTRQGGNASLVTLKE